MGAQLRVYVAAPFTEAARVRETHTILEGMGCRHTSYWAELFTEAERLTDATMRVHRAQWQMFHDQLRESDVVLALAGGGGGAQLFAEIGSAIAMDKPVLWVGERRILACYSPNVILETDIASAMQRIAMVAKGAPVAQRAMLLAEFVGPDCPRCGASRCVPSKFQDMSEGWQCRRCDAMFPRIAPSSAARSAS